MEVGAVKQAFNNEVIHLKQKMNQAKIQVIHKLTRKAKMLTEKKGPENIQAKMKRKAESAVNEVLQIKKVTTKDLAKFSVTHEGKLTDYLNKPVIDINRACARLLLHKSLHDKYNLFRTRYTGIAIDDLLMSREERRKIKKEQREKAIEKRRKKMEKKDEWHVEEIHHVKKPAENGDQDFKHDNVEGESETFNNKSKKLRHFEETLQNHDDQSLESDENESRDDDSDDNLVQAKMSNVKDDLISNSEIEDSEQELESEGENAEEISENYTGPEKSVTMNLRNNNKRLDGDIGNEPEEKKLKLTDIEKKSNNKGTKLQNNNLKIDRVTNSQNKKKNIDKIQKKRDKFQMKKTQEPPKVEGTRTVDPFFITASGEKYMSLVEPRAPDEMKEEHEQGNRKLRRALMFGRTPRFKPREFTNYDNIKNNREDNFDRNKKSSFSNKNSNNDLNKNSNDFKEKVPEKLHPSWEAKKRQSGIKPFEGKKIVFD